MAHEGNDSMKVEIRRALNGVILRVDHGDEEPAEEIVYQEQEGGEIAAFAEFLDLLLTHYGPQSSRYSAKRISIRIAPGDKYEDPALEPE
jgi:hypothetical protein